MPRRPIEYDEIAYWRTQMRIALGSDHAGFEYKTAIGKFLVAAGHEIHDFGTYSTEPVDYPDFIRPAAGPSPRRVRAGRRAGRLGQRRSDGGQPHPRRALCLCWNLETARLGRQA